MPRGRHRNPEPLHRLLTPTLVAGVSISSAGVAWLLAEPIPLRLLVALTAATGVAGAALMRSWDRSAGRRVAELARERVKDEWRTEERIAELESDLEEARVLRARLDAKLRAKRVELAGLRGEHAALLRRYATAETERATALEKRRLLAIEASAATAPPKELPAVSEERTSSGAPTSVGYARANVALVALGRRAEVPGPSGDGPSGGQPSGDGPSEGQPSGDRPSEGQPSGGQAPAGRPSAVPARRLAAAVAPYSPPRHSASRVEGGFDFFGTKTAAQARAAIEAVQNEDLADVVGAEALAAHKAEATSPEGAPEFKPATPEQRAVGQVIDLTAHDETEPIRVGKLRTAIS
ncbi:coiled-coil domain-containing protein [Streptomyces sp. NPDC090022]|uniref:coiled-coil domain-containing protein n=1 Tax=Streptomyces sp. NPDC090022 TaxID=3365920 RepID=UPI00382783B0